MGTVYHADLKVPRGFQRVCAVKVMKATGPDRDHFVTRMRDEARLLGMLQDEQVLGVSELVMVEDRDAVIMEYVDGIDLADLIKVARVPPRALAELGAEIAGVLHRAHNAKHPQTAEPLHVIHRDVKPANVMITPRGGVRLLDFGVARAAFANRESQTQGLVLGTLNYFPPEILAGQEPTPAVDIYGLGLTLWECATGREWGSPQVQQKRFERRVDQRLAEIEEQYKHLLPVLRQILQWDPMLRPDGGVVERALLHAADSCAGEGLRTWARDIVPPMLANRDAQAARDELVGRTVPITVVGDPGGDDDYSEVSRGFEDLAPPPASVRRKKDGAATPTPAPASEARTSEVSPASQEVTRPRRPRPKSTSFFWMAASAFLLTMFVIFAASVAIAFIAFYVGG